MGVQKMADEDLEERLNASPEEQSELEEKVKEEEKKKAPTEKSDWTIGNIVKDTLLYSPIGIAAYLLGDPACFLTAAGLTIGKWIANRKKKKKNTWSDTRKTLGVGFVGGALAYWAYSIPDMILGSPVSWIGKIAKTLLFNPLMTAPWIAWYRTTSYMVEKHGMWDTLKSPLNGKIFKYVKEAYHNDLKKKYGLYFNATRLAEQLPLTLNKILKK